MDIFERSLRRALNNCPAVYVDTFRRVGHGFYMVINDNVRLKITFNTTGIHKQYTAMLFTALDKNMGELDRIMVHFKEVFGTKSAGITDIGNEYYWMVARRTDQGWSKSEPTAQEFERLGNVINDYINLFK